MQAAVHLRPDDYHPFKPGGPLVPDSRGRRNPSCLACGAIARARRHWTPEQSAAAALKQGASRRRSNAWRRLAEGPRGSPQVLPPPQLAALEPVPRVADWRLSMLRLALDQSLEGPSLSFALRRSLLDARAALRSELYGLPATDRVEPPTHAAVDYGPARVGPLEPLARPSPQVEESSARRRALSRKIRDDRTRALVERAVAAGWQWRVTGTGHVALTGPAGESLVMSATPSDHRGYLNNRARARRLGLDVSGL